MKKKDTLLAMNVISFTAAVGTLGGILFPEKIITIPTAFIGGAGADLSIHLYSMIPYFAVVLMFTILLRTKTVKKLLA